jgi:hypothetical protein
MVGTIPLVLCFYLSVRVDSSRKQDFLFMDIEPKLFLREAMASVQPFISHMHMIRIIIENRFIPTKTHEMMDLSILDGVVHKPNSLLL